MGHLHQNHLEDFIKNVNCQAHASDILVENQNLLGWVWGLRFQHSLQVIPEYTVQEHCLKGFIERLEVGLRVS